MRLGENLRDRLRARAYADRHTPLPLGLHYATEMGECSGQIVEATKVWRGHEGLVYAYNVKLPNGKTYHLPALYADPACVHCGARALGKWDEGVDPTCRPCSERLFKKGREARNSSMIREWVDAVGGAVRESTPEGHEAWGSRPPHAAYSNLDLVEWWYDDADADWSLFEGLADHVREDALVSMGRIMGAAQAFDLTVLELLDREAE